MSHHPCFNCKHHRYGVDVSDRLRTISGIYCCVRDAGNVIIFDDASLTAIREIGCIRREEKV
jgi:hypothetical protein